MLEYGSQVTIRNARSRDADAVAEVYAESWREAYRGIIPHLHLESMIDKRSTDWWRKSLRRSTGAHVIIINDKIAGYATSGISRSRGKFQGEIYELYIAPDYQGMGLGERLFEATRYSLEQRNLRGLVVWALFDNPRARDFYWRRGGRPIAEKIDNMGGAQLEKIAYGWK